MEKHPFNGTKTPPSATDASTRIPTMKSTVNNDTTRSKTAPTPRTLGPRDA